MYRLGYRVAPAHRCDPTTVRHGNFWLLGFPSDPIRSSLDNLDLPDSSNRSMSMPDLVRTPDRHKRLLGRGPDLKSSAVSRLPEAGLQVIATHPTGREVCLKQEHPLIVV